MMLDWIQSADDPDPLPVANEFNLFFTTAAKVEIEQNQNIRFQHDFTRNIDRFKCLPIHEKETLKKGQIEKQMWFSNRWDSN